MKTHYRTKGGIKRRFRFNKELTCKIVTFGDKGFVEDVKKIAREVERTLPAYTFAFSTELPVNNTPEAYAALNWIHFKN